MRGMLTIFKILKAERSLCTKLAVVFGIFDGNHIAVIGEGMWHF